MKWIILVYLTIAAGTTEGDISYTRLEHPAKDFQECVDIEQQINDIVHRGENQKQNMFVFSIGNIKICYMKLRPNVSMRIPLYQTPNGLVKNKNKEKSMWVIKYCGS